MNIFIWQSYGDIKVYECEDEGAMMRIVDRIAAATAEWGIESQIERLFSAIERTDDLRVMQREILSFFRRHGEHEMFEHGSFDIVQIP